MSGMEAVGLLLSILPLVISAAEHYQDIVRPLSRYRKFDAKVKIFQAGLHTQQTIYRNEASLLLCSVLGRAEAATMSDDATHPAWTDAGNERKVRAYLGDSWEACRDTVQAIEEVLNRMSDEARSLSDVVESDGQALLPFDKVAVRNLRKKFKFSFSSSRLKDQMEDLRTSIRDLQTLTEQVNRRRPTDHRPRGQNQVSHHNREVKTLRLVQKASSTLYETLGKCCKQHIEHRAHFGLSPTVRRGDEFNVTLEVSLRQPPQNAQSPAERTMWLSVETTLSAPCMSDHWIQPPDARNLLLPFQTLIADATTSALGSPPSAKRPEPPPGTSDTKRRKKNTALQTSSASSINEQTSFDLLKHAELCTYILALPQSSVALATKCCVGSMQKDDSCRSLVYVAPPSYRGAKREPTSLLKLLETLESRNAAGRVPQYERAKFARLLATAALQFHNTPWLKGGQWRSEDVVLFDYHCDPHSTLAPLPAPYMDISVKAPNGPVAWTPPVHSRPWIRNPVLFGLALLLIQLAFERPLRSMQLIVDYLHHGDDLDAEFATAERLSKVVGSEMGERYRRLVDKCLWSYGADDLDKEEMQERYYSEVICELETIERKFQGLDIDD